VTEDQDISLQERCNRANKIVADNPDKKCLFVSIHINAAKDEGKTPEWHKATGWTVWVYTKASQASKDLAQDLYMHVDAFGLKGNRSVPKEHYWQANFKVLRSTNCPAVLTENMFMNNKADCDYLLSEEGKQDIIDLHIAGLCKYMELPYALICA